MTGARARCRTLAPETLPFRKVLEGRFRDIDARRHINNIAVAELFSEARTHFLHSLFAQVPRPDGMFFVVGQQAVFYAAEAHYPGTIEVGLGVFRAGRSSLRLGQAFFNDGRCTALADAVLICTHAGRAVSFPEGFADLARSFALADDALPRLLRDD